MKCVLLQFGEKKSIPFQWLIQPHVFHFNDLLYQFLNFGLSAPLEALLEKQRGTQLHSSYKHSKEAPSQGSSECGPMLQAFFRTRKDSTLPKTMKTMQKRIL